MTARALIASSLRKLGVLASGESLRAADAADALGILNDMIDGWRAERLTLYAQFRYVEALVSGTQRYTLGPTGDITQPRPAGAITHATILLDDYETPLKLYTPEQWAAISLKDIGSSLPEGIFINPTHPSAEIDVWPVPSAGSLSLVLYGRAEALTSVASLETDISQPPGWSKALIYNLAIELAPEYGRPVDPVIAELAGSSKATIKRVNMPTPLLEVDPALRRSGGSAWDYRTGDFR